MIRVISAVTVVLACVLNVAAQKSSVDQAMEDLLKPGATDPAFTNLPPLLPEPLWPLSPLPAMQERPQLVTKASKGWQNLPFTIDCVRQANDAVYFLLKVSHEGNLAHFSHADLYAGSNAHDPGAAHFAERVQLMPDRKATMRLAVPTVEIHKKDAESRSSMGAFQLPMSLVEGTALRLLCMKRAKEGRFLSVATYVVNLGSFVPEKGEQSHVHKDGSSCSTVDLDVDIL